MATILDVVHQHKLEAHWRDRFLALACQVASWSRDPSTKVGAVVFDDLKRIASVGFNGFPRNVNDDVARYNDRPTKYKLVVHAEVNAILNARSSVDGCAMMVTLHPCSDCTKMLIQAGIKTVYCPPPRTATHEDDEWAVDAKFSRLMMTEAGIIVRDLHSGHVVLPATAV